MMLVLAGVFRAISSYSKTEIGVFTVGSYFSTLSQLGNEEPSYCRCGHSLHGAPTYRMRTNRTCAGAAIADAAFPRICSDQHVAAPRISPERSLRSQNRVFPDHPFAAHGSNNRVADGAEVRYCCFNVGSTSRLSNTSLFSDGRSVRVIAD